MPKIIHVQGFCPLKAEISRFPIAFRLHFILEKRSVGNA